MIKNKKVCSPLIVRKSKKYYISVKYCSGSGGDGESVTDVL